MPVAHLAAELRRVGTAAGLDAVGICDASPFAETRQILLSRRGRGLSGGMQFTYRNPDRSTDPRRSLPGAASLVVGARRYERRLPATSRPARPESGSPDAAGPHQAGVGQASPNEARPAGRVAMYSWIDHYRPLRTALDAVARHLEEAGWQARVLVDDNALVDRPAAVRAGLGWYGKNTNVLLPGAGSWFVLGTVVTDAPLAETGRPPEAVADGCGSCVRCLTACPTGALAAGELDARRCLAWLVQAPGVFPRQYRVALGDRLYGCDDCQTACPVNRLASRRRPPPTAEADAEAAVDILSLLAADDAAVMQQVGRWYIPGRQARYVRRNALIVLGNTADPGDVEVIAAVARALADADPMIRAHAVWVAARLGLDALLTAAAFDPDPLVAEEYGAAPAVLRRAPT